MLGLVVKHPKQTNREKISSIPLPMAGLGILIYTTSQMLAHEEVYIALGDLKMLLVVDKLFIF